jgi:hypothetical protein
MRFILGDLKPVTPPLPGNSISPIENKISHFFTRWIRLQTRLKLNVLIAHDSMQEDKACDLFVDLDLDAWY